MHFLAIAAPILLAYAHVASVWILKMDAMGCRARNAQDDSLLVPGLMGSLFKHSVHLAAGKSLFQQFAAIRQMPSRRQVCTNLPRSTTVVRFA
jgi:hypothetical protein